MDLLKERLAHYDTLLAAARGDIPVDLAVRGATILNVMSGELLPGDIGIHKGFIVSLFARGLRAVEEVDAAGKIAIPALIDPHVHIESSMILPPAYAEAVALHGTGTVFTDPHEIVNVMGVDGFRLMQDNAHDLPVRIYFDASTCVPCKRTAESAGADIQAGDIHEMLDLGARKLGELMSIEEIVSGEPIMAGIIKAGWERGIARDTHFPMIDVLSAMFSGLSLLDKLRIFPGVVFPPLRRLAVNTLVRKMRARDYPDLNAYLVALGLTADHEVLGPEAQLKLDYGLRFMLKPHIFMLPVLPDLLLTQVKHLRYTDMVGACTDDLWPDELVGNDGLMGFLRDIIRRGIDPVDAVRFATLNNAQRLAQAGLAEAALLGMIAPGLVADIVLLEPPLRDLRVNTVIHAGRVVVRGGQLTRPVPAPRVPEAALHTVKVGALTEDSFIIRAGSANGSVRARVMAIPKPPEMPLPRLIEEDVPVANGVVDAAGYITIAVFNRYGRGSGPSLGLIKNYDLKAGAIASTLSHDSHNLIVMGTNARDMCIAASRVAAMSGGMAAVRDGQILADIAFPVGGLMSTAPLPEMVSAAARFRDSIASLGLNPKQPLLPFVVFSLPAVSGPKVTDLGLWDDTRKAHVPLLA